MLPGPGLSHRDVAMAHTFGESERTLAQLWAPLAPHFVKGHPSLFSSICASAQLRADARSLSGFVS